MVSLSTITFAIFYKGKLKPYKDVPDFEKTSPVWDWNGKIIYATSGACSHAKIEAIESAIEKAAEILIEAGNSNQAAGAVRSQKTEGGS